MSDDIVAFLRARLAEDEQVARAATPGPWRWDLGGGAFEDDPPQPLADPVRDGWGHNGPDLVTVAVHDEQVGGRTIPVPDIVVTSTGYDADQVVVKRADAAHIARWDPARVLREVEAKRRLIAEIVPRVQSMDEQISTEWGGSLDDAAGDLLRLLATAYADHPDYRPEWAP